MGYINISIFDLLIALIFVGITLVVSHWAKLGLENDLLIGTFRAFIQLLAVGFVLQQVFNASSWYWVLLALSIMIFSAGWNAAKRQTGSREGTLVLMTGSIILGSAIILSVVIGVVLRVRPWYQPQYVIPIGGMIIGNAMTGAALALNRLRSEVTLRRNQIEAALALGASPRLAAAEAIRESLKAAMMPTINSMMTVGIVQLPGMMTGQIISGTSPTAAVRYQIVVVLMISAATAITTISTVLGGLRLYFTKDWQVAPSLELGKQWDMFKRQSNRQQKAK